VDTALIWLVIAAVVFGIAAFAPLATGERTGLRVGLVPLGLMCMAIAEIVLRS
jgi:hypothetical protein